MTNGVVYGAGKQQMGSWTVVAPTSAGESKYVVASRAAKEMAS